MLYMITRAVCTHIRIIYIDHASIIRTELAYVAMYRSYTHMLYMRIKQEKKAY